jgi:hypothetical protein
LLIIGRGEKSMCTIKRKVKKIIKPNDKYIFVFLSKSKLL